MLSSNAMLIASLGWRSKRTEPLSVEYSHVVSNIGVHIGSDAEIPVCSPDSLLRGTLLPMGNFVWKSVIVVSA